jgi:hypothetical protein
VPSELKRLAADRIRDLEIPDLALDLGEAQIFECREDSNDGRADEKTDCYLFLERHGPQYHKKRPERKSEKA